MVDKRLAVVKYAWQVVSGKSGSVPFEVLQSKYNADAHPRVRTREKKVETIRADFVNLLGEHVNASGHVEEKDFLQYYADINCCLPAEKDDYFVDLVLKTWGIKGEK